MAADKAILSAAIRVYPRDPRVKEEQTCYEFV